MKSGELSRETGVSVDTLRHYEQKGVLPRAPRQGNSYREYPADAVARVLTIRRALAIGFTLDDLARVFALRDSGTPPCRTVACIAEEKLSRLDQQIADLTTLRDRLHNIVIGWNQTLAATAAGRPAHLLDSLPDSPTNRQHIRRGR